MVSNWIRGKLKLNTAGFGFEERELVVIVIILISRSRLATQSPSRSRVYSQVTDPAPGPNSRVQLQPSWMGFTQVFSY